MRYELQEGILTIMSPAGSEHGALAMKLGAQLGMFVEDNDLGDRRSSRNWFPIWRADPDTVLAPDVGFVRKDRIPSDEHAEDLLSRRCRILLVEVRFAK